MATTDDARRESEKARERLNAIAQELASRTTPEHMKELAREKGEHWKEVAREKFVEAKDNAKETAKEKAREKVADWKATGREKLTDMKESAMHGGERVKVKAQQNPALLGGIAGALMGVGAGLLAKKLSHRGESYEQWNTAPRVYTPEYGYQPAVVGEARTPYSEPFGTTGYGAPAVGAGGVAISEDERGGRFEAAKENLSGKVDAAKENLSGKVDAAKHRIASAKERIGHAREKIPSREEMRYRSREYVNRTSEQHPWGLALASLGIGFLASFLLPESDLERQKLSGMKQRATERLNELGHELENKVSGEEEEEELDTVARSEALTTASMNEPIGPFGTDLEPGPNIH